MNHEIPKTIHYCWFGGKELSELSIKCIESWKKYFPDYEIKRWDETNFDLNICNYVKEAYKEKKWAFVSDYARFWILYNEGGIYFDTDVEVIKPFDEILMRGAFMGCEFGLKDSIVKVNPGLGIGAAPHMSIYKKMLDYYNSLSFYKSDGEMNLTTIVEYTTSILNEYGLKNVSKVQSVENVNIYPPEYFCPMNYETGEINITDNTYSIHQYSESWKSAVQQRQNKILHKLVKIFGKKCGYSLWRIYTLPNRIHVKFQKKGLFGTIRFAFNKVMGKKNE